MASHLLDCCIRDLVGFQNEIRFFLRNFSAWGLLLTCQVVKSNGIKKDFYFERARGGASRKAKVTAWLLPLHTYPEVTVSLIPP